MLVIDLQEKFRYRITEFARIVHNVMILIKAFKALALPAAVFEQYPQGLGKTVSEITRLTHGVFPCFEKTAFSCTNADGFQQWRNEHDICNFVVCGIEAHVCVNHTTHSLLYGGDSVHIVVDAIGSIHKSDFFVSIEKMKLSGAIPVTVQMCLFELMDSKDDPDFKRLLALLKDGD